MAPTPSNWSHNMMEGTSMRKMDISKNEGMNYQVIANIVSGYCLCEILGKNTYSKQVSDIVRKMFLKFGI